MKILALPLILVLATCSHHASAQTPSSSGIIISQATLDSYVGTYRITPGFALKIWRELDVLKVQSEGQPARTLSAESENSFRVSGLDATINFELDASGGVSFLTLVEQGRVTKGLRE